jgi:1-acyl-sn-glycerol-3-phosphate acyltransferase
MKTPWYALRSLLFYAGYVLIMVVQPLVGFLLYYLLPARWLRAWLVSACRVAVWWAKVSCGIRYRVEGAGNIPAGACVVLSKHQSAWETLFLQAYLEPTTTVAKRELLRIPFFGWGMALTGPIAIDRDKPSQALKDVIRQGSEHLAAGKRVIIFPEGTRTLPGEQREYSAGGAMLAVRAGVPVLPVALNSASCWPRGTLIKKPGLIRVVIGEPLPAAGSTAKALNAQARAWIESTSAELVTA